MNKCHLPSRWPHVNGSTYATDQAHVPHGNDLVMPERCEIKRLRPNRSNIEGQCSLSGTLGVHRPALIPPNADSSEVWLSAGQDTCLEGAVTAWSRQVCEAGPWPWLIEKRSRPGIPARAGATRHGRSSRPWHLFSCDLQHVPTTPRVC